MPDPVRPVINHVAISVDAEVLDESGRAALLDFFGEVFGWVEGDNSTERGNPLILYTGEMRQYLYLLPASDDFLRAPRLDHFGLEIASRRRSWWPSSTGPRPTRRRTTGSPSSTWTRWSRTVRRRTTR